MILENFLLFLYFGSHQSMYTFGLEMGNCQDSTPTSLEFLSTLLDVTEQSVEKVAQDLIFSETPEENIFFVLYLPTNKTQNITSDEDALKFINPENPTKILIHGWSASASHEWIPEMASLYHQKGNYNVIAPDWSIDAAESYVHGSGVSRSIGYIIGDFILNIMKKSPNFPSKVHILGHSIGGQVAGFTGKKVSESGMKIDRITGLDVASPLFEAPHERSSSLRISSTDATFVDLIHTNKGMYGVTKPYGHVDFFINNGGPVQPGCENIDFNEASSCSHQRAPTVYSETILEEHKFEANACAGNGDSKVLLGEGVSREASGPFYVRI